MKGRERGKEGVGVKSFVWFDASGKFQCAVEFCVAKETFL